jgi:hypothetical protein
MLDVEGRILGEQRVAEGVEGRFRGWHSSRPRLSADVLVRVIFERISAESTQISYPPYGVSHPETEDALDLLEQPVAGDLQFGYPVDPGPKVVGNGRHRNGFDPEVSSSVPPLAEAQA